MTRRRDWLRPRWRNGTSKAGLGRIVAYIGCMTVLMALVGWLVILVARAPLGG